MAAELNWTPAAAGARSLRLVPPEVLEHAATGAIAYESHHYGIWLPDFLCSSPCSAAGVLFGCYTASRIEPEART